MSTLEPRERHALTTHEPPPLPVLTPVTWQGYKRVAEERHDVNSRMETGSELAQRAQRGLNRIRDAMEATGRPADELDAMLASSFAFGAAHLIQDFMSRR